MLELKGRDYDLNRFDFQETFTNTPEDDLSSFVEKKIFKFKNRLHSDSLETFNQRQARVEKRQAERFQSNEYKKVFANLKSAFTENNCE